MIRFLKIKSSCQGFGRCLPAGAQIAESALTDTQRADAELLVGYGLAEWLERYPVKAEPESAEKKKKASK